MNFYQKIFTTVYYRTILQYTQIYPAKYPELLAFVTQNKVFNGIFVSLSAKIKDMNQ